MTAGGSTVLVQEALGAIGEPIPAASRAEVVFPARVAGMPGGDELGRNGDEPAVAADRAEAEHRTRMEGNGGRYRLLYLAYRT